METFIGLQIIKSDTLIRINLEYYIEAVLEEYQKFDLRVFRGKQTPVQSGVLLSKDDSPAIPDPKPQSIYRSSPNYNLLQHGFNTIFRTLWHSWVDSVRRLDSLIGLHYVISCAI
jgi:hypothetical protein